MKIEPGKMKNKTGLHVLSVQCTIAKGDRDMIKTTGINHVALVCRDMKETVHFYSEILSMPLFKTVQLPDGGQHFFFDCGNNNSIAFFCLNLQARTHKSCYTKVPKVNTII